MRTKLTETERYLLHDVPHTCKQVFWFTLYQWIIPAVALLIVFVSFFVLVKSNEPLTIYVSGAVYDTDNNPLSGVRTTFNPPGSPVVDGDATKDAGMFLVGLEYDGTLADSSPSDVYLVFDKLGYRSVSYKIRSKSRRIETTELHIVMHPIGSESKPVKNSASGVAE